MNECELLCGALVYMDSGGLVSGAGDGYVQCYYELAVNVEASPGEDPGGNCILGSP